MIERMERQKALGRENLKALQEVIENVLLTPLESFRIPTIIEDEEDLGMQIMFRRVDLNKGRGESFLLRKGLEIPSVLIGNTDEQLGAVTKKAYDLNRQLGGQKDFIQKSINTSGSDQVKRKHLESLGLDYQISQVKRYRKAVQALKTGATTCTVTVWIRSTFCIN